MKKLWLDLELSGDIDDAVTLIFALESNFNVKSVSLLNPSKEELGFTKHWLNFFAQEVALFVHYDKNIKNTNNTHKIIKEYFSDDYPVFNLEQITDIDNYIVLGGGAYTIPNILYKKGFGEFILQGGFAGTNVCPEPTLEKFRNKVEVPSWNPNLDIKSTKELLKSKSKITFISKDICHDSAIDKDFVQTIKNSKTKDFLMKYLGDTDKSKKMHDLVALLYFYDNSFVNTVNVVMEEENCKWHSRHWKYSNKSISIGWDKSRFLGLMQKVF